MCFVVGGKLEIWRKIPGSKAITNNKLKPPKTAGPGVILRPRWWEASAFTTIPTQLLFWSGFKVDFDTCSLLHTHISAMRNMKPCSHFVSDVITIHIWWFVGQCSKKPLARKLLMITMKNLWTRCPRNSEPLWYCDNVKVLFVSWL